MKWKKLQKIDTCVHVCSIMYVCGNGIAYEISTQKQWIDSEKKKSIQSTRTVSLPQKFGISDIFFSLVVEKFGVGTVEKNGMFLTNEKIQKNAIKKGD